MFDPRLVYVFTLWTVNATDQDALFVNVGYQFNRKFNVYGGIAGGVLLAGGSSRIPLIGEMLRSEFERPVVADSHPKHAVALGSARVAAAAATSAPVRPR